VFQVLAIDGVSLGLPPSVTPEEASSLLGQKINIVACPGTASLLSFQASGAIPEQPVCATGMRMMPSTRAEIFVPGNVGKNQGQTQAVLRTINRDSGKDGDDWPRIDLARLTFPSAQDRAATGAPTYLAVAPDAAGALEPGGVFTGPVTTRLAATAPPVPISLLAPQPGASSDPATGTRASSLRPGSGLRCSQLAASQARQVLFGVPESGDFGHGYRRVAVGDTGPPASPEEAPIVAFDHAGPPTVCVRLGQGNDTVTETWMLVNLAGEDHNFHMHQTRFSVVATPGDGETVLPSTINGEPVLLDSVPLPHANGEACDGTVGPWIAGTCRPTFVTVSIPFHEVGDFVYHCHILEHADGGMMARITVVP
ncbi:MAG: multicopper oxidase domain-containing protein, partial [Geminicoccaceae bacterium]